MVFPHFLTAASCLLDPELASLSTRAQYYCGQTVNVPQLGDVVIIEEHIMQVEMLKITVGQLLEIKPMPVLREDEIKRKYVRGQPLVEPDEVKNLPTRIYEARFPIESPSW